MKLYSFLVLIIVFFQGCALSQYVNVFYPSQVGGDKLSLNDLKGMQFYIDCGIHDGGKKVLTFTASNISKERQSSISEGRGEVKIKTTEQRKEIVIPNGTPGICIDAHWDMMRAPFEVVLTIDFGDSVIIEFRSRNAELLQGNGDMDYDIFKPVTYELKIDGISYKKNEYGDFYLQASSSVIDLGTDIKTERKSIQGKTLK
jgi:hypothetical protein